MDGNKRGEFCVYVQGVHRGDDFGERSGRAEADGGRHDGEGCGLRFEDKGAETEYRVTKTGGNQDRDEAAEYIMT